MFLLNGNMSVGLVGEELMVRVGKDGYAKALGEPHVREMDFTGKALKGVSNSVRPGPWMSEAGSTVALWHEVFALPQQE